MLNTDFDLQAVVFFGGDAQCCLQFPSYNPTEIYDAVPKFAHERKMFTLLYFVGHTFFWGTAFYVCISHHLTDDGLI
jgi:hypothetical protein